jgi:hypothetical protein
VEGNETLTPSDLVVAGPRVEEVKHPLCQASLPRRPSQSLDQQDHDYSRMGSAETEVNDTDPRALSRASQVDMRAPWFRSQIE